MINEDSLAFFMSGGPTVEQADLQQLGDNLDGRAELTDFWRQEEVGRFHAQLVAAFRERSDDRGAVYTAHLPREFCDEC